MDETSPKPPERRSAQRHTIADAVRLFVLDPDGKPVAERYCAGVNLSPKGIAVRTPGTLDPGSRVIVVVGVENPDIWLACVAHVQVCPDGTRVLGLEKLQMSDAIATAQWLAALRAAA